MPHKRNPIRSERISGLARVLRSYTVAALENVALWHERDISHSSVERMMLPDVSVTLHFMLREMTKVVSGLQVYPDTMERNMNRYGGGNQPNAAVFVHRAQLDTTSSLSKLTAQGQSQFAERQQSLIPLLRPKADV